MYINNDVMMSCFDAELVEVSTMLALNLDVDENGPGLAPCRRGCVTRPDEQQNATLLAI